MLYYTSVILKLQQREDPIFIKNELEDLFLWLCFAYKYALFLAENPLVNMFL